jgi:CHAT domain-containing protein
MTEAAADKMYQSSKHWKVAGMGVTKAHPGFKALTGTQAELEALVKNTGNPKGLLEGKLYLDEAFTKDALIESLSDKYPLLHVASHFQFMGTERDSFLLLGDGSRLDLGELRQGRYDFKDVELLTLSACETALGGGEGKEIEGMAVTAQKKGAKGVLATLWPVADRSTAVLVQRMYELRETNKLSKAEALRQAQLDLYAGKIGAGIESPKTNATTIKTNSDAEREFRDLPRFVPDPKRPFEHPYYWAPFILMGNWL